MMHRLLLVLAFCSSISIAADLPSDQSGSPRPQSRRDSLRVGDEAPPFVMRDLLTDEPFYMRDFTGKTLRESWKKKERQVVVLSFWATWCQPCRIEIPVLSRMAEEFKNQPVRFFLVNTMEESTMTEDSVRLTYTSRGYTLPCLLDPSNRFQNAYTVRGLPMLVVVDKFGIVRKINRGYHEKFDIDLRELIRQLLKEDSPAVGK